MQFDTIGYIPKEKALCLDPLLDRDIISLAGVGLDGTVGYRDQRSALPVSLEVFARPEHMEKVKKVLRKGKIFPLYNPATTKDIGSGVHRFHVVCAHLSECIHH